MRTERAYLKPFQSHFDFSFDFFYFLPKFLVLSCFLHSYFIKLPFLALNLLTHWTVVILTEVFNIRFSVMGFLTVLAFFSG